MGMMELSKGQNNPHNPLKKGASAMKKAIAFLMILATLMISASAMASGYWYDGHGWWYINNYGNWTKLYQSEPMEWNTYLVNHNFPTSLMYDMSGMCDSYNGIPVGCLGLVSDKGSNLRSYPTTESTYMYLGGKHPSIVHNSIIRKLHADTTVYVYFSFWSGSDQWYYVTCADGTTGFLFASRIRLIPV